MSTAHNQSGLYKLDSLDHQLPPNDEENKLGSSSSEGQPQTPGKVEEVKEPDSGGKVKDSLLALIGSDMFSVHMLFTHLNRALLEGKA